jgi:putative aldouronate transport system substrate-binding protein
MSPSGMSRRTLFRAAGAGAAVAAAGPALVGCGGGGSTGSVGSAGKDLTPWPTYVPANGPKPDLPGSEAGVEPGYLKYPSDLTTSVASKPGDGSDVTALVITYEPPPKPASSNKLWSAVNAALGVNLKLVMVPSATFADKVSTLQAGGDLPDMMLAGTSASVARQAQFVAAKCADLSDYLGGDAIKKYPNLANIPPYVWRAMGRIGGKIYGVPIPRPRPGDILIANQTLLSKVGGLKGWDSDQFAAEMAKLSGHKHYGIGSNTGNSFGMTYHGASFGAPNGWQRSGGKFVSMYGTEQYKAALGFIRKLYQAGSYYPDVTTTSTVDMKTMFYNKTVASAVDGFVAYHTAIQAVKDQFVIDFGRPYTVDGKSSMWFGRGFFGYTVLKKASKARIETLLRILDYMAAPFGSKEYELTHFGVEGQHFTRDSDGQIKPTALADVENPDTVPIRYIADAPGVAFYPGDAGAAKRQYDYDADVVPMGVADPSQGLQSDTRDRTSATLGQLISDGINAVVTGRAPLSAWDDTVKKWRQGGGDAVAAELAKEYQAVNGK